MNSFRGGLLIGGLLVAVIALGVAVIVLATGDDDDDGGGGGGGAEATAEETSTDEPCLIPYGPPEANAEAELDLRSSELSCEEAGEIYAALDAREAVGFADSLEKPQREQGWACSFQPTALHPLLTSCSAPGRRFLVLSLEPVAHSFDPKPELPPPVGTEAKCGNLVQSGAGTYNVQANGVHCGDALQIAGSWEAICFGIDQGPNPCPVIDGFTCSQTQVGYELTKVQCFKGERAVDFENGA